MALPVSATLVGKQGQAPLRPSFQIRLSFVGDSSYPTGGTADFSDWLAARLGYNVTPLQVVGFGKTAGAITHFAEYDAANDKLMVFVLAGTQVPNATDISAVTFDLMISAR